MGKAAKSGGKKSMTKSAFVTHIAEKTSLTKKQVEAVLENIVETVKAQLKAAPNKIVLPGLARLTLTKVKAVKGGVEKINPLNGQKYITPALAGEVLESIQSDPGSSKDPVSSLTPRQREILQLLAEGKTAKEISAILGISTRTVEFHKYEMMQSAGIHTSAELVHFAIKHGLVEI